LAGRHTAEHLFTEQENVKGFYLRGIHFFSFFFLFLLFSLGGSEKEKNNLFDSSLLLARCGRSTGPMAVFACCPVRPGPDAAARRRTARGKIFCLMRFVIRKHRKT
jgi:hypothetical protein